MAGHDPYEIYADRWEQLKGQDPGSSIEREVMASLLPAKEGLDVLVVGSGPGEELGPLMDRQPRRVVALDRSQQMLSICRRRWPAVELCQADIDTHEWPQEEFDLIYSGFTVHYAADLGQLFAGMYSSLRPGGTLLFSTTHPLYRAGERIRGNDRDEMLIGWRREGDRQQLWGDYLGEGVRTANIFGELEAAYHYRTIEGTLRPLLHAGFHLQEFREPGAELAAAGSPHRLRSEVLARFPLCFIVAATRPENSENRPVRPPGRTTLSQ